MRILLTGAAGQLGRHLKPRLATLGEVVSTDLKGGDFRCDLSDRRLLDRTLQRVQPDLIVNPAAWTAVDRAEDEAEACFRLNRDMPSWLAAWCAQHDRLLVHFSTDYVFSGSISRGWREDDPPKPQSVYGRSKLEGEQALASSGARVLLLRTAWLYSHFPGNFLSAILGRAERGEHLRVVSDQTGSPTWAGHLAEACCRLLGRRNQLERGLNCFHVAGQGVFSWHQFASLAVQRAFELNLIDEAVQVDPIASASWPQKARRPEWSVLDCERFERFVGQTLPTVNEGLEACLQQWEQSVC
ncbi:MAG: dTDP-4-dehydrorhamnose reductase [Pseudomonadota bacterium]